MGGSGEFFKAVWTGVYESEEDSVSVNFIALVNGEKQSFNITYNMNANELLDASCEIFEEKEGL